MQDYNLIQAHIYANMNEAKAKINAAFAFKIAEQVPHLEMERRKRAELDKLTNIEKMINEFIDEHC